MPEILTTSSEIYCQHGGRAVLSSKQHDLFISGKQILIENDVHIIPPGLCSLSSSTPSSPCVKIRWFRGSPCSTNRKIKLLTRGSIGKCYNKDGIVQGIADIRSTQRKVASNG